jgi:hypothetical protein
MPIVQINNYMIIYKVINKINGKWYIGKDASNRPHYYGSGIAINNAINKYGKENFEKIILETCLDKDHLIQREKAWILESGAVNDPMSYNLASGGEGGDLSKFHDYTNQGYIGKQDQFVGRQKWWHNLTIEDQKERFAKQAEKRTKGWYVSRTNDPSETYVQNISKWCEDNGVDKSMPSSLNNPKSHLFQKQTKGWRIRRSDMPELPPYKNMRGKVVIDNNCTGKTWKLVNGKRVWCDK